MSITDEPMGTREQCMMGAILGEAVRLKLDTAALRRVAARIEQLTDQPDACALFSIPIGCGKHSVHELNGKQWFCRSCYRYFQTQDQAEHHG